LASFFEVLEAMNRYYEDDNENQPLLDSGEESKGMNAIRNGMNIRKPECGEFWEDFITVAGNADAMADLLEVPREKVTSWASKIRELIEKVNNADGESGDKDSEGDQKAGMLPTGNDGPIGGEDAGITNRRPDPS